MHQFDAFAESYQDEVERSISFIGQSHDFFIRSKAEYIRRIAAKYGILAMEQSRGLDVGCGVGLMDTYLEGTFTSLYGVDTAEGVVHEARARNTFARYSTYDGQTFPYENGYFDFTFTVNVLHHVDVDHREHVLREMKRVTK